MEDYDTGYDLGWRTARDRLPWPLGLSYFNSYRQTGFFDGYNSYIAQVVRT